MTKSIKSIGVLTSGGDAPGMNAALRAVVRAASFYKKQVYGIYEGYKGLIEEDIKSLNSRSVKNILNRGGTVLKSSRCDDFRTRQGRQKAFNNLQKHNIDALVIIGGNGTFTGGMHFCNEYDIPVMGIPGTIDNDLYGTDYTLGFDTATNVVIEAVDKIRDTAESHNRLFFVEVMGRDSGFIALRTGLASGALDMVLPEEEAPWEDLLEALRNAESNKKTNKLIIVSEGNKLGSTMLIAEKVREVFPHLESKVTILGHLQRGGPPSCFDRILASQLGVGAVERLLKGHRAEMVGIINNQLAYTPFEKAISQRTAIDQELIRISKILAT